ncbi:MAG TPA: NAD-dependent succinate-semialdehyde dehydrogenase [Solirubrobacteraceae bacterium]|nr:NAD-dependent succinate-semialdehyde dehydrogenase [Solirubrobacteraceae bacterium]
MTVTTVDPSTGEVLATYHETSPEAVDGILGHAHDTASDWRLTPPAERGDGLRRLAASLRDRREELALMASREMGKPLADSRAEVEKCAWACEWFAEHGPALLETDPVQTDALDSYVAYVPLGVVFAIMPWNFPYWQVVRALAPALAAGNVIVLKHAPSTTGCSLLLADVAERAGLPAGVLSVIVASVERTPDVSEAVITDDRVAAVTLTGSTGAGRAVAAIAGRALKKTVLELGGSDPFIVLADADLDAAAEWATRSRFQNTGQSCIAAKRIIVEQRVADEFTDRLLAHVAQLRIGDPTDPAVTVGPLARADLRDHLAQQVRESVAQGARVLAGGRAPDGPGFYYEPTVLDQVTGSMPVLREEVFGPAAPVLRAANAEAAITLANDTSFGLGSNIWTSDLARGEQLALRLDAGHTAINWMTTSDPRLPFGGIKDSGYGRELSTYGIHEFVNVHTVVVEAPAGPAGAPRTIE